MKELIEEYRGFQIWKDRFTNEYYSKGASLFEPTNSIFYRGKTVEQVKAITDTLLQKCKLEKWIPLFPEF